MTVHLLKLYAQPPGQMPADALANAIDGMTNSPWDADPDPSSSTLRERYTGEDGAGTRFIVGTYRYEIDSTQPDPLDEMESNIQSVVQWYRILYHVCDHDEAERGDCGWDDPPREDGDIPAEIPMR